MPDVVRSSLSTTPASSNPATVRSPTGVSWKRFCAAESTFSVTPPELVLTFALLITASTALETSFSAIDNPTEIATPVVPPTATPMAAAMTIAWIAEWSVASSFRLATSTVGRAPVPPSMPALTSVEISFWAKEPAADAATPVVPPPPMAAAPAMTCASIDCDDDAVSDTAPAEWMLAAETSASTLAASRLTPTWRHSVVSE